MNFDACSCSGKTLNRLVQPAIMAVLVDQPLHGYLIAQRLRGMIMFKAQPPDPTGLYRLLKSMEHDGLLTSSWDLADSGPARRLFALTPAGRACLKRWAKTLEEYQAALTDLLAVLHGRAARKKSR